MSTLKDLFLLDPEIIFLNHGSFGACPRPVFAVYQEWQRRLERQPVRFLTVEYPALDREARQALGDYLGADAGDLVYIPNATHGVNIVARSLNLGPGDEVLATDHEYGACDYTWQFISRKTGLHYCRQPISLPISSADEVVEQFWRGVRARTRLIFISQITSSTAVRLPVEEICRRARQAGILTMIDGAHAPGQIAVNLEELGADFYTGNCHKWMLGPKGAGFLYARKEAQPLVEPLVVSWGTCADEAMTTGSQFIDRLQWSGTRDPAAALAAPAAIRFMEEYHWEAVREECRHLLCQALERIGELTGLPPVYGEGREFDQQMAVAPLPSGTDLMALKERLYGEYHIEAPLLAWNGYKLIRISVQGYNTQQDVDALVEALKDLLPNTQA